MIEFAQKDEMSTRKLAAKPCVHFVALTAKPIVMNDDDRTSELRDVRGHLARPLLLERALAKMPMRCRLEAGRAVERQAVMKRFAQQVQRLRVSFFDRQLEERTAIRRLANPAVHWIDFRDRVLPSNARAHVEDGDRQQDHEDEIAAATH